MSGYAFAFLMLFQSVQPAVKDDIAESLKLAQNLYYEARFNDSIQLLTRVNDELQSKPDRLADKVNAKLQLALANIGLNENEKAKALLIQMYSLSPDTELDPDTYSPKIISLATEAKNEMVRVRCQTIGDNARKSLKDGNATAVRSLIGSPDSKCIDMAAMSTDAADLLFKTGQEAYKRSEYPAALQNFQAALKFSPKHEMAAQYVELAQGRLQVAQDRALIQFQKDFDARQLSDAAADYRQIVSYSDGPNAPAVRLAADQYRKVLTTLVDTWNRTCPTGDTSTMNAIRGQIGELLPEPSFGEDIRSKMSTCIKPELKAEVKPETQPETKPEARSEVKPEVKAISLNAPKSSSCLKVDFQVAMTRIKTKVNPEIPREARAFIQNSQVTVRVKVRIDENGNVVSSETASGNPVFSNAVKNAVDQWKFSPAMDANGTRCLETEIPIAIGPLVGR